jgi:hypothetical protein
LRDALALMSGEVRRVKFEAPDPFDSDITFWPLGLNGYQRFPFKERMDRLLILSPHLWWTTDRIIESGRILCFAARELKQRS